MRLPRGVWHPVVPMPRWSNATACAGSIRKLCASGVSREDPPTNTRYLSGTISHTFRASSKIASDLGSMLTVTSCVSPGPSFTFFVKFGVAETAVGRSGAERK